MRAEGMPWKDIAAAARISASTARRRWSSARLDRELRHLAPPVAQPAQPSGRGRHLPRQSPAEDGAPPGTSDKAAPPPEETPLTSAQQLAAALSHLQRASRLPMRELGQAAGVSASYVSRVLSGERVPSWDVTRRIAVACGGDPPAIRTLWRTARGLTTSAKIAPVDAVDAVHAALRGLYLSAGQPDPHDISLGCHNTMTEREITATLDGERLPDWPTLGRLVLALDGRPATMRPLWEAAHRNPAPAASPRPPRPALTRSADPAPVPHPQSKGEDDAPHHHGSLPMRRRTGTASPSLRRRAVRGHPSPARLHRLLRTPARRLPAVRLPPSRRPCRGGTGRPQRPGRPRRRLAPHPEQPAPRGPRLAAAPHPHRPRGPPASPAPPTAARRLYARLPAPQAEAMLLHLEGLSIPEAADLTGNEAGTLAYRLRSAQSTLDARLALAPPLTPGATPVLRPNREANASWPYQRVPARTGKCQSPWRLLSGARVDELLGERTPS
ncbi:hypothetical protein GCM10020000_02100 [Streptomyces olivoverticillatus]